MPLSLPSRLPIALAPAEMSEYKPPLICFINAEGFAEPLIALWSPEALDLLEENVREGRSGLNRVVGVMESVKTIKPLREVGIMGCNTKSEWDGAMCILKQSGG